MLDYTIIQKDMGYDLAYLQLRSLSEHKMIDPYAYVRHEDVYSTGKDIAYLIEELDSTGTILSYQQNMVGYILYNNDDNILSIGDLYARNKDYLDDPFCVYNLGQSLLHKTILDNPQTEEIILQSTINAQNFYRKMGFEIYKPSKPYEMTMPRNHIEMWLDTPLYERPTGLPVYEDIVSSKRGQPVIQLV
jgi:hypothetical protein